MCNMERLSNGNMMQRFAIVCKERDELRRENKWLKEELRQMKESAAEAARVRVDPKWRAGFEREMKNGHDRH